MKVGYHSSTLLKRCHSVPQSYHRLAAIVALGFVEKAGVAGTGRPYSRGTGYLADIGLMPIENKAGQ